MARRSRRDPKTPPSAVRAGNGAGAIGGAGDDGILVAAAFVVDDGPGEGSTSRSGNAHSKEGRDLLTDDLGAWMGARLEAMEVAVDATLHRVLVGEIHQVVARFLFVGVLLGVVISDIDETTTLPGGISLAKLTPWLVRCLWLGVLPLLLPDVVRAVGDAVGTKDPMKSSVVILSSCAVAVPLWMSVSEAVFVALLRDLAGDRV